MTSVAALDRMPRDDAAELLRACCGAERWVEGMLARRPFGTREAVLAAADAVWLALGPTDWREAFDHHPRIGEERSAARQSGRARAWSEGEQAGMHHAATSLRTALAEANAAYERRFGYICIVCATGRSPQELLAATEERLRNPADAELTVAAEEQRKITRLRLEKLLGDSSTMERR